MPLTSFGSILTFSEEIEVQDMAFYSGAANHPGCADLKPVFEEFIKECKKNIAIIQRTRRENVTEMILEPINDFVRTPFCMATQDSAAMSAEAIIETAKAMEQRALDYFTTAAAKIKALPEVSTALKLLAKKHTARLNKIAGI